jgi:hypothetical protein
VPVKKKKEILCVWRDTPIRLHADTPIRVSRSPAINRRATVVCPSGTRTGLRIKPQAPNTYLGLPWETRSNVRSPEGATGISGYGWFLGASSAGPLQGLSDKPKTQGTCLAGQIVLVLVLVLGWDCLFASLPGHFVSGWLLSCCPSRTKTIHPSKRLALS